jgi:transcriptional regulator with AAA-type ATPase domain
MSCHSEHSEESAFASVCQNSRFLATLGMTTKHESSCAGRAKSAERRAKTGLESRVIDSRCAWRVPYFNYLLIANCYLLIASIKESTVSKFEIAVRLYKSYLITEALERFHGNQSATARNLGLHRNSLRRNIKVLGIKLEQGPHAVRKPPAGVKQAVQMPARSSEQLEA